VTNLEDSILAHAYEKKSETYLDTLCGRNVHQKSPQWASQSHRWQVIWQKTATILDRWHRVSLSPSCYYLRHCTSTQRRETTC